MDFYLDKAILIGIPLLSLFDFEKAVKPWWFHLKYNKFYHSLLRAKQKLLNMVHFFGKMVTSLTLTAIPLCEIIIAYLKNKPMGMQTFLDQILMDLYRYYQIYIFIDFVCITASPMDLMYAVLFGIIYDIALFTFLSSILMYFLVKLLYISEQ